jgi:alanine racemase
VTDLPEDAVSLGALAKLFGAEVEIDDFATRSGTIGYEVLTSLGPRYRRNYVRV